MDTAINAIAELKSLPADWDSHGAEPIDHSAVGDAMSFLYAVQRLMGAAYEEPIVGPTPDHGVGLVWPNRRLGEVEVRFSPRGNRYVVVQNGKLVERGPISGDFKLFIQQYIIT